LWPFCAVTGRAQFGERRQRHQEITDPFEPEDEDACRRLVDPRRPT
jgi:hypothetical protein